MSYVLQDDSIEFGINVDELATILNFRKGSGASASSIVAYRFLDKEKGVELLAPESRMYTNTTWNYYKEDGVMFGEKTYNVKGYNYNVYLPTEQEYEDLNLSSLYSSVEVITSTDSNREGYYIYRRGTSRFEAPKSVATGYYVYLMFKRYLYPIFSIKNMDLGDILNEFTPIYYTINCDDTLTFTVVTKLNGITIKTETNQTSSSSYELNIDLNKARFGKNKIDIETYYTDSSENINKVSIVFNKIKTPVQPCPTTSSLKQAIAHNEEIEKEIEYQLVRFSDELKEKGVEVLPGYKLSSLIDKVGNIEIKKWASGHSSPTGRGNNYFINVNNLEFTPKTVFVYGGTGSYYHFNFFTNEIISNVAAGPVLSGYYYGSSSTKINNDSNITINNNSFSAKILNLATQFINGNYTWLAIE